jgi:hypothetical protein
MYTRLAEDSNANCSSQANKIAEPPAGSILPPKNTDLFNAANRVPPMCLSASSATIG